VAALIKRQRPEALRSLQNPLLKDVRKAVVRGELTSHGYAVAEGFHLLEEALRSDREVECVIASDSVWPAVAKYVRRLPGVRMCTVADKLFSQIASTETSQGVIALVRPVAWSFEELLRGRSMVVVLDAVQDPGNAGAIVRAAEAFGATGCVFLRGTVSPHNPKALRASAGSLFRLPYVYGADPDLVRAAFEQNQLDVYAAVPSDGKLLEEMNLRRKFALVLGSEGRGVSEVFRSAATPLSIPTAGVESLNVALSAGIILYEASRQRVLR